MTQVPAISGDKPDKPVDPRHVLYPNHYAWFILFSALDIMLTHRILNIGRLGEFTHEIFGQEGAFEGRELNSIADWVIKAFGLWGAIGLKFASVILAILICEYIGRKVPLTGRKVVMLAVLMSIFPVAWELVVLAWFAFAPAH